MDKVIVMATRNFIINILENGRNNTELDLAMGE